MCGCTNQTLYILGVSDPYHKTMNHSLCGLVQHNVNRDSAGGLHLECVPLHYKSDRTLATYRRRGRGSARVKRNRLIHVYTVSPLGNSKHFSSVLALLKPGKGSSLQPFLRDAPACFPNAKGAPGKGRDVT